MERGLFRFTLGSPLNGMIVGLGLLLVGEVVIVKIWGTDARSVTAAFDGRLDLGGVSLSFNRLVALAITIAGGVVIIFFLERTRLGKRMAAAQGDPVAAAHVGINVGWIISLAFVLGSALAGTAGAVLGTLFPVDPYEGGNFIIRGFAVALLGGLGSVTGAVAASLLYGIGETMVAGYLDPSWVPVFTFGVIVVILLVHPGGLLGRNHGSTSGAYVQQRGRADERSRSGAPWPRYGGVMLALIAAVVGYHLMPSTRLQAIVALAAVYVIVVYALSLLFHQAGMLSVAHGGLMAIGAYTAALLANYYGLGFWASLIPVAALSGLVGALVGVPVARARGHYFVLLTLAFGSLIIVLIQNMKSLTQGDQGLLVASPPGAIGPLRFDSLDGQFYLAFGFAVAAGVLVWSISRSALGARLAAIRDNEDLARSLGLYVQWYKVVAFAISGGIAGTAGALFVYQQTIIVPDSFTVLASIQLVIMLVLGGRSTFGPAVGVVVISLLPEALGLDPVTKQLAYGIALVAIILVLPAGVVPSIRYGVAVVVSHLRRRPGRSSTV
jgi:branched-chain amino acid transport system permease protein